MYKLEYYIYEVPLDSTPNIETGINFHKKA